MTPKPALSPPYHAPLSRPPMRRRRKPIAFYPYLVAVNDDGYPVEEPPLTDRPRVLRLANCTPGRARGEAETLRREARIRWHSVRIARRE